MDPNENPEVENNQQNRSNAAVDAAKQQGKKALEKMAKEGLKKGSQQVAGHAAGSAATGAFSSVLAALLPYILIAVVVILIIIMIIGLVAFFVTMPGMMQGKIDKVFENMSKSVQSVYKGSVEAGITEKEVIELANYIESMEYDLVGFGFVRPDLEISTKTIEQLKNDGYKEVHKENPDKGNDGESDNLIFLEDESGNKYNGSFYYSDGKKYDGSTGKIVINSNGEYTRYGITYDKENKLKGIQDDSSILRTYAMSEKRLYVLRNNDETLLRRIAQFLYKNFTGYSGSWAQGLIELYTSDEGIADGRYDLWDKVSKLSKVEITGNNQLKVKVGFLNNPMLFDLDGWTGRYGLSTDFLISLHLATLSPDLVTTIAQTFDTRVQVYLDYVKDARVDSFYHTGNMSADEYVPLEMLEDYKQDSSWNFFDSWFLSRKEAKKVLEECNIDSLKSGKYTCGGNDPSEVKYCYNGSNGYNQTSNICFNEAISNGEAKWNENVFYNTYIDDCHEWANEGSGGNGVVKVKKIDGVASDEDAEAFFQDCGKGLGDGDERPAIVLHDAGAYLNNSVDGASKNDADLEKVRNVIDTLVEMYGIVQDDIYGDNNFNIVSDPGPRDCPLTYGTIFDPDSEYYFEKYIPFSDFKTIAQDNDGYTEVVVGAWSTNREMKRDGDDGYNPDYDAELILSLIIRKTETDKNFDLSIVLYRTYDFVEMVEKGFDGSNNAITCSEKDKLKEACPNCRRYVSDIMKALKKIDDENYKTYVPHIARVVGSWFRDTYFIIPKSDSGDLAIKDVYNDYDEYSSGSLTFNNVKVIQNDEAFLEKTGELWTEYIYDKDDYTYALFVINPDGSYLESQADINKWKNEYYKDLPEEIYNSIGILNKDGIDYFGYIDIKSDSNEDIDIEKLFKENEVPFVKRPKNIQLEDVDGFNGWSAYEYDGIMSDEKKALEINEDTPEKIKRVHDAYNFDKPTEENVFYYTLLSEENVVTQNLNAQRGMTNEKIKYLFKNKKYYKYDGSIERAFAIKDDWQNCVSLLKETDALKDAKSEAKLKKFARTGIRIALFGHSNLFAAIAAANANGEIDEIKDAEETVINGYIDAIYYKDNDILRDLSDLKFARDFDGDNNADLVSKNLENSLNIGDTYDGLKITESTKFDYDPRNPDLINKIDINTESLTAFSILENTHTADADYAYRDLKELFCELDYFDKEDLTEPVKDVLEWPLPDTTSTGWPVRLYDKSNEYGSLIHSSAMYKNLMDIDESVTSTTNSSQTDEDSTDASTATTFSGYEKAQPVVSPATAKILEIGTVEVTNENTKTILDRFYVSSDNESVDAENDSKTVITTEQKEELQKMVQGLEEDNNNPLGKSYTTGYIKLEVIGEKSLENFEGINQDVYNGFKAFYADYYNETNKKSICDSYTIYIEGIDLTSSLETSGNLDRFGETIIGKIIEENLKENIKLNIDGTDTEYQTNYYTERTAPEYYVKSARDEIKEKEELKKNLSSVIKNNNDIYIKAGTLIGVTGDSNIKIIMKDKEEAVVENVEDYLEIENNKSVKMTDDVLAFFFIPYEGVNSLVGTYQTQHYYSENETAIGIMQWTSKSDGLANIQSLCEYLYNADPSWCRELQTFTSWNFLKLMDDIYGANRNRSAEESSLYKAFKKLDSENHDRLLQMQMEYAINNWKENWINEEDMWILDRSAALKGTYFSLLNWRPGYNNSYSENGGGKWSEALDESKTDEQMVIDLLKKAYNISEEHQARWDSQGKFAIDMLNGTLTEDDVFSIMQEGLEWGDSRYSNGKNTGFVNSH